MLAMTLLTCSACTTPVAVTNHDWCLNDRWMCHGHADTAETQRQIDVHNAGYGAACPKQPHVCK